MQVHTTRIIKKALIDKDFRQTELAKRLRVSTQVIWDVIHGRSKNSQVRAGLAALLDLDPSVWENGNE
jgi:ribosome-binding protein aMBF1 (putative translation factor)